MEAVPRKPAAKVESINRQPHSYDAISQEDLQYISALQANAWQADQAAQEAVLALERRIANNSAKIQDGPLYFDEELRMVRTRKAAGAG